MKYKPDWCDVVVSFLFGMGLAAMLTVSAYRHAAIKRGFAEYNQATGRWQWKEFQVIMQGIDEGPPTGGYLTNLNWGTNNAPAWSDETLTPEQ